MLVYDSIRFLGLPPADAPTLVRDLRNPRRFYHVYTEVGGWRYCTCDPFSLDLIDCNRPCRHIKQVAAGGGIRPDHQPAQCSPIQEAHTHA